MNIQRVYISVAFIRLHANKVSVDIPPNSTPTKEAKRLRMDVWKRDYRTYPRPSDYGWAIYETPTSTTPFLKSENWDEYFDKETAGL